MLKLHSVFRDLSRSFPYGALRTKNPGAWVCDFYRCLYGIVGYADAERHSIPEPFTAVILADKLCGRSSASVRQRGGLTMRGFGFKRRDTWPSDMVITVDEHVQNLKMLLFVRQTWSLALDLNIPELSPVPETGHSQIPESPSRAVWEMLWKREWDRAWAWYDIRSDREAAPTQDEMRDFSRPGQDLNPLMPPFWTAEHGEDGLDWAAFETWDRKTTPIPPINVEFDHIPTLVSAWQAGLTNVIVLPYRGFFAHRLNASHLVVSAETRHNPESYDRALSGWI